MLFTRKSHAMPAPEDTLPGRPGADARHRAARRARHAARAAVPRRDRDGGLRDGLLLGRRAPLLAAARRLHDRGRLRRRHDAQPDLRGDLLRPHRAHGGRPRRLRPGAGSPTTSCCGSSGRATTRPRGCGRGTTSARSTARRSTGRRRPAGGGARRRRTRYASRARRRPGHGAITTELAEAGPFYYAETYHQQYLARNPTRLLRASAAPGVACPVGTGVSG